MSEFKNAAGLIDIGKAGCSDTSFLATFNKESVRRLRGAMLESDARYSEVFWPKFA